MPDTCARQAVKNFTHHGSWGTNGGEYLWNHIDGAWTNAAMKMLVCHVRGGGSLSELPIENEVSCVVDRHGVVDPGTEEDSIGGFMHDDESGIAGDDEDNIENYTGNSNLATLPALFAIEVAHKTKRTPQSVPGRSLASLDAISSSESPSAERAARAKKPSNNLGSSSSPLSSVPRNLPGRGGRGGRSSDRVVTTTGTDDIIRYRTRSVTRVARVSASVTRKVDRDRDTRVKQTAKGRGCVAKRDGDTGESYCMWPFERILDSRRDKTGDDFEYKVKWVHSKPTWQPAVDLQDNPEDIAEFHDKKPDKPGPPVWFLRSRGQDTAK